MDIFTSNLLISKLGLLISDEDLRMAAPGACRIDQQLRVARLVQADEPKGGLIDALPDSQQAMVLQDAGLSGAKGLGNTLPLLAVQDDAAEVVVHGMRLVKAEGILRDHVQLAAEDREGFAIDGVCMACRVDVRAGFVDCKAWVGCEYRYHGGKSGIRLDTYFRSGLQMLRRLWAHLLSPRPRPRSP